MVEIDFIKTFAMIFQIRVGKKYWKEKPYTKAISGYLTMIRLWMIFLLFLNFYSLTFQ